MPPTMEERKPYREFLKIAGVLYKFAKRYIATKNKMLPTKLKTPSAIEMSKTLGWAKRRKMVENAIIGAIMTPIMRRSVADLPIDLADPNDIPAPGTP